MAVVQVGTTEVRPDASDAPIFVSGIPRSGTTWMQWFLCQHPEIHVHGQLPPFDWQAGWEWYHQLVAAGSSAARSNAEIAYPIPHYAGSDEERCRRLFAQFLRGFLCGFAPEKPRWGIKSLKWCVEPGVVPQVETLWPEARWVVCIRDPFLAIASEKNTFRPDVDLNAAARGWVEICEFAHRHDPRRTVVFQIDQVADEEQRARATAQVLECIGAAHTPETLQAIREFPVIHQVKPSEQRSFEFSTDAKQRLLDEVPGLRPWMQQMGYNPSGG